MPPLKGPTTGCTASPNRPPHLCKGRFEINSRVARKKASFSQQRDGLLFLPKGDRQTTLISPFERRRESKVRLSRTSALESFARAPWPRSARSSCEPASNPQGRDVRFVV